MSILVTGAAGFIGFHVANALLARGEQVIGVDCLNDYYEVSLKEARLAKLQAHPAFTFIKADISEAETFTGLATHHADISRIVHLAAQAGVRYSTTHPESYITSNVMGQMRVLEFARASGKIEHFVYASSSSVYGGNPKIPFAESDPVDQPLSLYGATKRADELITATYAHLYGLPSTGLRFFTVYGPYGRPDMAYFIFTKALYDGDEITLYNHGTMHRDFTFVSDIVAGVLAALDKPPVRIGMEPPHRILNLGNSKPEAMADVLALLEAVTGRKANVKIAPRLSSEAAHTSADLLLSRETIGFVPKVSLQDGMAKFVAWYCEYYGINILKEQRT